MAKAIIFRPNDYGKMNKFQAAIGYFKQASIDLYSSFIIQV